MPASRTAARRTRPHPAPLREFGRDGWTFDVIDDGPRDGECVVLLHGFPADARSWDGLVGSLGGAFRTLALDQRGYSPRARPREVRAYRVDELTADVLALADAAGVERFHLVGHDWGGLVGWHLAAHHPRRVQTLTVLSTPHPRALAESMTRSWQPVRSAYAVAWQVPIVPEIVMLAGRGRALQAGLQASGLDEETAQRYTARMREPGALRAALNWYRASGRSPRRLSMLPAVEVPTLYVWSTNDAALGATAAHRTARHVVGRYRFEVLQGVSHWIPELAPARTAALISQHAGG